MTTLTELKSLFRRSQATLFQDALGMVALSTILIAGLHLPAFI